MDGLFPATGNVPDVKAVQAIAFHDADGRIHHIHHVIVLEGGRSVNHEALMREAKDQARSLGVDISASSSVSVRAAYPTSSQRVSCRAKMRRRKNSWSR